MTAVEFLVEELKKRSIDLTLWHKDLVEQAKEIFEQQIEEAYKKGFNDASPSKIDFGSISIGKF